MAAIVRLRPVVSDSAPSSATRPLDQFDADLSDLRRRIELYEQMIADCATELYELKQQLQTVMQSQAAMLETWLPADPSQSQPRLSMRERQLLRFAASGLRTTEIADLLKISTGTVKNYFSAILTKLGVRSRLQAVLMARELGLI